ncbi:MAG: hypothetical protein WD749_00545 [Phycisphaerales bacterium]
MADRGELDIIPKVQFPIEAPTDYSRSFIVGEVTAGARDAKVRNAFIETSDAIPLRPCWASLGTSGFDPSRGFTLPAGQTVSLYFAVRRSDGPGQLLPPDYYSAPWGHLSTAIRIVVECVDGTHTSKANGPLREFANWVAGYRNRAGPHGPGYAMKGMNVPHGR